MVFHFVQGGGVVVLLDEGLNEIEDLFLSLGEHWVEFRFTFDNSILGGQSQEKDRGELTYCRSSTASVSTWFVCGNMSKACSDVIRYRGKLAHNPCRSRTSDCALQER